MFELPAKKPKLEETEVSSEVTKDKLVTSKEPKADSNQRNSEKRPKDTKKYKCEICGNRDCIHEYTKKFACNRCGYSTYRKRNLRAHDIRFHKKPESKAASDGDRPSQRTFDESFLSFISDGTRSPHRDHNYANPKTA